MLLVGIILTQPAVASVEAAYLESDIMSSASTAQYLASGSFDISGATYFRGVISAVYCNLSITYDIAGRDFTRLTGTFGKMGLLC